MQRAQVREVDVAEHVLGNQRRAEQQDRVGHDDREGQRPQRQRAGTEQHRHIAPCHHERERLEAGWVDAQAESLKGPGQPVRPAAAARGDIQRGGVRRAGRHAEDADEHREQAERAKDTERNRRRPTGGLCLPCPAAADGRRQNSPPRVARYACTGCNLSIVAGRRTDSDTPFRTATSYSDRSICARRSGHEQGPTAYATPIPQDNLLSRPRGRSLGRGGPF